MQSKIGQVNMQHLLARYHSLMGCAEPPIVLIVDDMKESLDAVQEQLQFVYADQVNCEITLSGEEALAWLQELSVHERKHIAVVLTDYIMPGIKGDAFLIAINQLLPDSIKLIFSGCWELPMFAAQRNDRKFLDDSDLFRHFAKPWSEKEIIHTVAEALQKHVGRLEANALIAQAMQADD